MRTLEIILTPEEAFDEVQFESTLYKKVGVKLDGDTIVQPIKRSIDARSRNVIVRLQCEIFSRSEKKSAINYSRDLPNVSNSRSVIIIGSGPAGLFAALRLIELNIKPIVLERAKTYKQEDATLLQLIK